MGLHGPGRRGHAALPKPELDSQHESAPAIKPTTLTPSTKSHFLTVCKLQGKPASQRGSLAGGGLCQQEGTLPPTKDDEEGDIRDISEYFKSEEATTEATTKAGEGGLHEDDKSPDSGVQFDPLAMGNLW